MRKLGKDHAGARKRGDDDSELRQFLTGPQVCARYAITDMSLWRWLHDADTNFPKPDLVVRGRRYWAEGALRDWELQRARCAARAAR